MTSPPRMLNSQAIDAGAVITAASRPDWISAAAIRLRLDAESSPANSRGCGTTGAAGWAGRALQAASSGLSSTGFSVAPALAVAWYRQAEQGVGAVQAWIVADHLAWLGHGLQPGADAAVDQVPGLEQGGVDLVAHLQGVASIDEHRGPCRP